MFTNIKAPKMPGSEEDTWNATETGNKDSSDHPDRTIQNFKPTTNFTQNLNRPSSSRHSPRLVVPLRENESSRAEDLLVSDLTHFYPIKDDAEFADGTSFPIDNTVPAVTFTRSQSGKLYRPESNTPYFEYHPWKSDGLQLDEIFPLKFRACNNDQTTQTDFEMNGITVDFTDHVKENFKANEALGGMTSHANHEDHFYCTTKNADSQSKQSEIDFHDVDLDRGYIDKILESPEVCEPPICETPTRPVPKCKRRLIFSEPENHSEVHSISNENKYLSGVHPLRNSLDIKDKKVKDFKECNLKEIRKAFLNINSNSWYLNKPPNLLPNRPSSSDEKSPSPLHNPSTLEESRPLPPDCPPSVEERPSSPPLPISLENGMTQLAMDEGARFNHASNFYTRCDPLPTRQQYTILPQDNNIQSSQYRPHNETSPFTKISQYNVTSPCNISQSNRIPYQYRHRSSYNKAPHPSQLPYPKWIIRN